MTTLAEVREGLKELLKTIDGLRVFHYVPDDIAPPAAVLLPPTIPDYREDLGEGVVLARFPVMLLVGSNVDRKQLELFELIDRTGPRSLFALVEDNRDLGGLNVDAHAVNVEDFDTERFGLLNYFARVVNVDVWIS